MAEVCPFRGLRYDPSAVRPDDVIAPPYDVVDDARAEALLARSSYNIAHVELCRGDADDRYEAAAEALARWEAEGVLRRDAEPAFYVYEQRFEAARQQRTRLGFFARLRLSPPEAGEVLPHEATMSGPKEDRLNLLRATRTNVSPIFGLFRDADGRARGVLTEVAAGPPDFATGDGDEEQHRLWVVRDPASIEALTSVLAGSQVTIADGHHRYATALNYLAEQGGDGADEERPEAWVLAGLVPEDDPGLIVLPIHRLIRGDGVPDNLRARLEQLYEVRDLAPERWEEAGVRDLWERVRAGEGAGPVFGLMDGQTKRLSLLSARSSEAIEAALPSEWSEASRAVDVLVLTETILRPLLGLDAVALAAGERVAFTEHSREAFEQVSSGAYRLAFLVNAVSPRQVTEVAAAGELLPQKSTFFYPKLGTGLVLNPLD